MPPQQALRGHLWGGASESIALSIVVVKSFDHWLDQWSGGKALVPLFVFIGNFSV